MDGEKNKTIIIDDIEYNIDDFNEEQKLILSHVQDLDRKVKSAQFNLDQLSIGREAFVKMLAESLEQEVSEAV